MEIRDLIVSPIIILLVYLSAYLVRPLITDAITRKYFFPALTLRIIGALTVGFIYQFYYGFGDTLTYHEGSRVLWDAFTESPFLAIKLFLHDSTDSGYSYYSKIVVYDDPASYTVTQLAFIFDLVTFSSYSGTAIFFALFGFLGSWLMFLVFYDLYPHLHKWMAYSIFFIPSVLFWGSGILKDTITFACVGITLYSSYHL